MSGALKGMLMASANTIVVAVCLATLDNSFAAAFVFIVMFAFIPAVITGALVGHVAAAATRMNRAVLLVGMISVSCFAVAVLGSTFGVGNDFVLLSCIPTAAACSVLERWTRPRDEMPIARVA